MNYYERHIGDYLKDTAHLSLLEHGIYGRLLDIYYSREVGLPADQIERLVGARTEEEKASLRCVLEEFFVLEAGGLYVQSRCDQEIARFQDKQRKAKASAAASWAHRRAEHQQSERIATAMPTHSEGNAPSLQTPDPVTKEKEKPARKRATSLPDEFRVSRRVYDWCQEKGFSPSRTAANLESLVSYAKRKGVKYIDWDEALMTAIRENWAKEGGSTVMSFQERDAEAKRLRMQELTGGLASAKPPGQRAEILEVFDVAPRLVGR